MFIIPAIPPECKAKRRVSQKRLCFFATTSGLVFFTIDKPLVLEHEVAFKLIRRLHA